MNKVILLGNLARDPEVRYTTGENQLAIARFSIAVNRRFQSRNSQNSGNTEVDFFNCVAFGKTGENIGKFFTKGRKIAITGRLQNNNWEDKNGQKRYDIEVVVEEFDFCDRKGDGDSSGFNPSASYGSSAPAQDKPAGEDKFYDMPETEEDEELPF